MVFIPGIQVSSGFSLSSPGPLDKKMMLSSDDRKNLTYVQRRLGMIVFDTDKNKWYQLINNPEGQDYTVDDDWQDLLSNNTISANYGKENYTIDEDDNKEHELQHKPLENSVQVFINGIEQLEGHQYTVDYDNKKVIFDDDIDYVEGDYILIKYMYTNEDDDDE